MLQQQQDKVQKTRGKNSKEEKYIHLANLHDEEKLAQGLCTPR